MFSSLTSTLIGKLALPLILTVGISSAVINSASAADQCTTSNNSTGNTILAIGTLGAGTASQTINAILVTEGQIGVMADRILWTELQIGAMANRIVYVTQFSQTNTIAAIYVIANLTYLGKVDGQYKYSGTVVPVSSKPFGW
jgi:hypothetical protein